MSPSSDEGLLGENRAVCGPHVSRLSLAGAQGEGTRRVPLCPCQAGAPGDRGVTPQSAGPVGGGPGTAPACEARREGSGSFDISGDQPHRPTRALDLCSLCSRSHKGKENWIWLHKKSDP